MWIKPCTYLHLPQLPPFLSTHHLHFGDSPLEKLEIPAHNALPKQKKIERTQLRRPILQWYTPIKTKQLQGCCLFLLMSLLRFRTLSLEERQQVTQIRDTPLVDGIVRLCGENNLDTLKVAIDFNRFKDNAPFNQRFLIRLFETRQISRGKMEAEREFLKAIRLVCLEKPAIILSQQFLQNPEAYFDHLSEVSEGYIFECSTTQHSNQYSDNPLWFSSLSFNSLAEWICSDIEKGMMRRYQKTLLTPKTKTLLLDGEASALRDAKDFIEFCESRSRETKAEGEEQMPQTPGKDIQRWMNLRMEETSFSAIGEFQQRLEEVFEQFNHEKTKALFEDIDQLMTEKKKDKKPPRPRKQDKRKNLQTNKCEEQSTSLRQSSSVEEQSKDPYSELLSDSLQIVTQDDFQEESIIPLKSMIPLESIIPLDSAFREETEYPDQDCGGNGEAAEGELPREKGLVCSPEIPEEKGVSAKREILDEKGPSVEADFQETTMSHSPSESIEFNKKRKCCPKKKKKNFDKLSETLFEKWLENGVESFVDSMSIESNKLLEARILIFQRIRYFVSKLYKDNNIDTVLFGSNAVGLSLVSSDIDILLKGFDLENNQNLAGLLERLSSQFKKMRWVVESSIYPSAKVPIIKLLVDPSCPFLDSYAPTSEQVGLLSEIGDYLELKKPSNYGLVSVDITVDVRNTENNHLGCLSTVYMKESLQKHDYLHQLVLALKYLLFKKGLNKPFKGGLNSYGLLLLCTAFLKEYPQSSLSSALLNLLQFYSSVFKNKDQVIEIGVCSSFKDLPAKEESQCSIPLSIIDPLNGRLMSANCTSFSQIKEELERLLRRIQGVKECMREEICQMEGVQLKSLQEKKKKFLDKFLRKFQKSHRIKEMMDVDGAEY